MTYITILADMPLLDQMVPDATDCVACQSIIADAITGGTPTEDHLTHYVEHVTMTQDRRDMATTQAIIEKKAKRWLERSIEEQADYEHSLQCFDEHCGNCGW